MGAAGVRRSGEFGGGGGGGVIIVGGKSRWNNGKNFRRPASLVPPSAVLPVSALVDNRAINLDCY